MNNIYKDTETLMIFPDKSSNVVVINYLCGFNGSRIVGRH